MAGIHDFTTFLVAAIALNLIPGADTLYILGRSLSQGRKAGILSVLGISTGVLFHTLAASLGLSVILAASSLAFSVVKYLGAIYLIYLGVRMFRTEEPAAPQTACHKKETSPGAIYREGILTNVLNPKVALFFLAFLPQFITPGNPYGPLPFLLLGTTFILTGTGWCLLVAYFASAFSARLRIASRPGNMVKKITGTLFIGLGLKLALEKA